MSQGRPLIVPIILIASIIGLVYAFGWLFDEKPDIATVFAAVGLFVTVSSWMAGSQRAKSRKNAEPDTPPGNSPGEAAPAQPDDPALTPFRAKVDSGLFGGLFAGFIFGVLGSLFYVYYYELSPEGLSFFTVLAEITIFATFGLCILGACCEIFSAYFRRLTELGSAKSAWLNEATGCMVGALCTALLFGPITGFYFGQYMLERPFMDPGPALLVCVASAGMIAACIAVFKTDKKFLNALRCLLIAALCCFIFGGIGYALTQGLDLKRLFFDLLYPNYPEESHASSLILGGMAYVGFVAFYMGLTIGATDTLARICCARPQA